MPGKVNPVIPEAVAQAAIAVMGHDQMILQAVGGGNLELSQFLPLVADSLLTSLDLLTGACDIFARHCVSGIEADAHRCRRNIHNSTATADRAGGQDRLRAAEQLAAEVAASHCGQLNIRQLVIDRGLLTAEEFDELTSPETGRIAIGKESDWERQLCNAMLPKLSACTSACSAAATPASRRC